MFRRRIPRPLWQRLRGWLWPHVGWRRAGAYYVKRLLRLPGTPYSIAAGFACGVGVSFTPLVGGHLLAAAAVALLLRSNVLAAWAGTLVGNPLTFPFLWLVSYHAGVLILGDNAIVSSARDAWSMGWMWDNYSRLAWPMTVGGIPVGIAAGLATYLPLVRIVAAYQEARRRRRERRRGRIRLKATGGPSPDAPRPAE